MPNATNPANAERSRHFAEDGHPLNVPRAGRYHDAENGVAVCGECAVNHARDEHNGWNTKQSTAILDRYGYTREPMNFKREDQDWCCDCDKDFLS